MDREAPLEGLVLRRIAARRPFVHCLMNTVAQPLVANALIAIGAEVSMASHPAEVVALAAKADALAVNLGTLDRTRERAIEALIAAAPGIPAPVLLDPVFVERSPLRMALAERLVAFPRLIVKGNAPEMAALAGRLPSDILRITTGEVDLLEQGGRRARIVGGHPLLARITGSGCALGALIAAALAVEAEPFDAALAMLRSYRQAATRAGAAAQGPGSFAVRLIDELHAIAENGP